MVVTSQEEMSSKISPKIFIVIGIVAIVAFFTSVIVTIIGMAKYENSRFITYPTMLIAVSIYFIYILLDRKQLILDLPHKKQMKYLLIVIAVITMLQAIVFLCFVY